MSPTHDPAISELLSFFDFSHLPPHLAAASEPFHWTAHTMVANPGAAVDVLRSVLLRMESEDGREAAAAALKLRRLEVALVAPDYAVIDATGIEDFLRTLLEAKDCAVRAALVRHRDQEALTRAPAAGAEAEPKRECLADFVVGIDVEQGPGLAVLRDLVAELGAVADRLEAVLPDDVDGPHVDALRGLHNAPPPVIVSRTVRTFTDEDGCPHVVKSEDCKP